LIDIIVIYLLNRQIGWKKIIMILYNKTLGNGPMWFVVAVKIHRKITANFPK
jgi:hypothetical protein